MNLNDILDEMLLAERMNENSYVKTKNKELYLLHAKNAIKDLTFDMANDVLALELNIGSDLQFVFPQDYVDWVRVSVVQDVNGEKKLFELDRNENANRARTYLQDNNYQILFDNAGDTLDADGYNVYNFPMKKEVFSTATPQFQKDTSKLSKNGLFSINKRRGVFTFDEGLEGKAIVVEYISDGLQWETLDGSDITVHKYFREPLEALTYLKLIQRDREVPMNEKQRAERDFWGKRQKAYARFANIKLAEVSKAFRANLKWVKT